MRAPLVIAGMIAGVSAAHAAERDNLVSVFQAVCMTSGSFSDSMRNFAKAKGWTVETLPDGEVSSVFSKATVKTKYRPDRDPSAFHITWFPARKSEASEVNQGQAVESCWVSEPGMRKVQAEAQLRAIEILPQPVRPVSAEVRRYFGREGPNQDSLQWSLEQQPWDYIVLYETQHLGERTSLIRLRPFTRKMP